MSRIDKASVLFLEFVAFSMIGWIYETVYTSFLWGRYIDRGFLDIPLCPIYGFAGLLLIAVFPKKLNPLLVFSGATVLIGVLEFTASYILEKCFSLTLWDYNYMKWNIDGRVSVVICLGFGIASVILVKWLHPTLFSFFSEKLKKAARYTAVATFLAVILIDTAKIIFF